MEHARRRTPGSGCRARSTRGGCAASRRAQRSSPTTAARCRRQDAAGAASEESLRRSAESSCQTRRSPRAVCSLVAGHEPRGTSCRRPTSKAVGCLRLRPGPQTRPRRRADVLFRDRHLWSRSPTDHRRTDRIVRGALRQPPWLQRPSLINFGLAHATIAACAITNGRASTMVKARCVLEPLRELIDVYPPPGAMSFATCTQQSTRRCSNPSSQLVHERVCGNVATRAEAGRRIRTAPVWQYISSPKRLRRPRSSSAIARTCTRHSPPTPLVA